MTRATVLQDSAVFQWSEAAQVLRAADPNRMRSLEDLCLTERIEGALHATGYRALHAIQVSVSASVVQIVGQVPSYYLKQIAQTTVLAVPGAHQIHNYLDVVQPN